MVPLFYADDCLMLGPYKDKIEEVYASLQTEFKTKGNGNLNKYLGIELQHCPDGSIQLRQPYLTQRIINIVPGLDKSSDKPTPEFKPPLAKIYKSQERKKILITDL